MPEVTVTGLGARGDGIAETSDGPLYVAYAAPGDRLVVTPPDAAGAVRRARIERIVSPGADRRVPVCEHFGDCGGCSVQHIADDAYGVWKTGLLRNALRQRGLDDVPMAALAVSPAGSRRRARFAVQARRGQVRLGFNAARSRRVVALRQCPVLRPAIVAAVPALRGLLAALPGRVTTDVQVTASDTGLDVWLTGVAAEDLATRRLLAEAADAVDWARFAVGDDKDVVVARRTPAVSLDGVEVTLPVGSFLQATAEGEAALVAAVAAAAAGATRVAELFAGLGAFSFALARAAQVTAIDADPAAIDALAAAARRAPGLRRLDAQRRDLFRRPLAGPELAGFDAVVFDPPRAGAIAQAEALAAAGPLLVIAVSCNPATFARDARVLVDGGYRLEALTPVDQFLWSAHLELVAVFRR